MMKLLPLRDKMTFCYQQWRGKEGEGRWKRKRGRVRSSSNWHAARACTPTCSHRPLDDCCCCCLASGRAWLDLADWLAPLAWPGSGSEPNQPRCSSGSAAGLGNEATASGAVKLPQTKLGEEKEKKKQKQKKRMTTLVVILKFKFLYKYVHAHPATHTHTHIENIQLYVCWCIRMPQSRRRRRRRH